MTREAPFPQSNLGEELATLYLYLQLLTLSLRSLFSKLANKKIIALTELTGKSSIFGDVNFLSLAACLFTKSGFRAATKEIHNEKK